MLADYAAAHARLAAIVSLIETRAGVAPVARFPAYGSDAHVAMFDAFVAKTAKQEAQFGDVCGRVMEEQRGEILKRLGTGAKASGIIELIKNPFNKEKWDTKMFR